MSSPHFEVICALTARQHGLFGTRQAMKEGVPRDWLKRWAATGLIVPFRRGVWLLAGAQPSPHRELMAACLAAGAANVAASHLSAAGLYGTRVLLPNGMDVTTFGGRTPLLADVRTHQTSKFSSQDLGVVEGIPVTSPARTALDLAGMLPLGLLGRAMNDLLRRRVCRAEDFVEVVQRLGGRGRPGTRAFRLLAEERVHSELPTDSDWADRLMRRLEAMGIAGSVEQYVVTAGPKSYVLDRAWPGLLTGLEFDGFDSHGLVRDDFDHDRERDLLLEAMGWRIHRVTSRSNAMHVAAALRRSFASAHTRHDASAS